MPKPPLHDEPVVQTWRNQRVHWHAYDLPAGHSRPSQRAERLAGLPVAAVLRAPEEVVDWIEGRHAEHVPHSLPEAWAGRAPFCVVQATEENRVYRELTNEIIASKGDSLYIELKSYPTALGETVAEVLRCGLPTRTPLRELWIEAVGEPDCRVKGHAIPAQRDNEEEVIIYGQAADSASASAPAEAGAEHPEAARPTRPKG